VITVYKFLSGFGQADLSPFVFKVETYLRMIGLEYKSAAGDPRKSPKGKLPYIDHDGQILGDSTFIIDHLKSKLGDKLDANLSTKERAIATAFKGMIEEQLYFVILYQRWKEDAGWATYQPVLREYLAASGIPGLLRGMVLATVRKSMLKSLHAQGTGRHASGEVDAIGMRVVGAIADQLGDGPFFLGARPTSIDATVYPFVTGILDTPFPSNVKKQMETMPPLRAYVDRMKHTYWAS
jgi:glutathione S-transferase